MANNICSCAGRVIITQSGPKSGYGIDWLYLSHSLIETTEEKEKIWETLQTKILKEQDWEVWFKMEPVIVAIRAKTLDSAQKLLDYSRYHFKFLIKLECTVASKIVAFVVCEITRFDNY
jgi:tRNA(Phe) wybutosine-synthesizing methylase Tyw3